MTRYQIENTNSGCILGIYEAETGEAAILAMCADSGSTDAPSDELAAFDTRTLTSGRIKDHPEAIIGQPVAAIDGFDWLECYPVVSGGVVVGVQTGDGDVLDGPGSDYPPTP